ncbi:MULTISPECIES: YiiX/YebB-like N1pC/P60 family cysteine hydrolase [Bacillaceae]|uniref:YycO n=1 Tax=Gottfriedia luciferensis TaxID=178774 RepID=A0ABX2ZLJ6_9BACI|nr:MULTISPECIES: YiiX/YebB-like N1pC/P60 family cysteine hydrolase [Bacillaceae]ODG90587.1 hypothetical protein BED47_12000 [Gottfriedia luciferensis]PGZ94189.1 hypothetical protein COE53_03160 [Bacillus sp. AFS029533]SFD19408.1 Uncharacterized protein YycO [Bacillus sp. UNCCL81]
MKMKNVLGISIGALLALGVQNPTFAAAIKLSKTDALVSEVSKFEKGLTTTQILKDAKEVARTQHMSVDDVLAQMKKELSADKAKASKERSNVIKPLGGSGGTVIIGSSTKGNFYYTDSQTAYLNHGHVGMYYTTTTIVESIPDKGVRTISSSSRKVDTGAVIKSVNTTQAKRDAAANWAYGELGEDYSYNFATNRQTSTSGAKNCSKLVWSAFKEKAGLDLDVDKGLGVYPRDVRDAKDTTKVKTL